MMSITPLPKKALGQHWLTDNHVLEAIAAYAAIQPDDMVLEIGPGLGTLTAVLATQAKQVVAVEFDARLAQDLPARVPAKNVTVVTQDILGFDFTSLPPGYKLVANIPYYLTSNLIRVLSESTNPPSTVVLLVQKEVAERLAAKPGDMSVLSVTAQFYWQVSLGQVVTAKLFTPPPKVDSQVVVLKRHEDVLFPDVDPKVLFRLVKAGFAQRRKTLLNALSAGLRLSRATVEQALQAADLDPRARAQTLGLEQWHALSLALAVAR